MNINAETIKQRVPMTLVAERYGFKLYKGQFISCPFHSEKTASCKVYPDNRGYYCYGCGEGGDVIRFVQKLFGLTFPQSIERINVDFALGLPTARRMTDRELRKSLNTLKQIEAEKAAKKALDDALFDEYMSAMGEVERLLSYRKLKPRAPQEEMNPLFVEYLNNIEYAQYRLDCVCERMYYNEHNEHTKPLAGVLG